MSQRASGFERKERDLYETPAWVTHALVPHLPRRAVLTEPAAGSGKMAKALCDAGYVVVASDIETGNDFLAQYETEEAIVTNPPYALAAKFICQALVRTERSRGYIAMLLRTDFDHARTRQHLFGDRPQFAKKLVLTKRIQWFEDSKGSPSFNHAWFIWDWQHKGPPTLAYGP